jgi:hypothetical protein
MQEQLFRLVYTSRAAANLNDEALDQILNVARATNPLANITGQLLLEQGVFAQWLEGPQDAVEKLWAKLQRDTRHHAVQLVSAYRIETRSFGNWSMALTCAQPQNIGHVQGFVSEHVAELPVIMGFPDRVLALFDLLAELESLNRRPAVQ